jgi:hypothetical protein
MLNDIHHARQGIRRIARLLVLAPVLFIASCSSDPRMEALEKCVRLLEGIVRSRVLLDAVKNDDPEMRATTAARGALTGGVTANFPRPPDDISIVDDLKNIQPWSVILIGDDGAKQVRVEAYGSSIDKPAIVKIVKFPPG